MSLPLFFRESALDALARIFESDVEFFCQRAAHMRLMMRRYGDDHFLQKNRAGARRAMLAMA